MRTVVGILAAMGSYSSWPPAARATSPGESGRGSKGPGAGTRCGAGGDPAPVLTTVEEQGRDRLPAETLAPLTEVRDLLTSAAGQSPEQAQAALEEAVGKLDGTLSQVETAVDAAPDQLTKTRL